MNPYLEGNFAPVNAEHTELDLPVTGQLPDFLDGRYLHNGPNPAGTVDPATYHWFLGAGMVHGLRLGGGRAQWYRNRWVRSADVLAALGEPPRSEKGPVHAGFDFSPNTSIVGFAGRTLAIVEGGGRPYELTDELDTVGPCDFDGTLPGGYTAHPLVDPATGEMHAVSYFFGWGNRVRYTVTGTDGRVRKSVDIEVGGSPMMHAFSLTESSVIIYDLPVTFDAHIASQAAPGPVSKVVEAGMRRVVGRRRIPEPVVAAMNAAGSPSFPYSWNPDYPARIGVMARDGDRPSAAGTADVRWFDVEPCYVYHPLNAYDDGDHIVLEVTRHPRTFDRAASGPFEGLPTFDRWTIDPGAGKVIEERVDDRGNEFPRIDDRLVGRRHRYGYTLGYPDSLAAGAVAGANAVVRHDGQTGTATRREFGAGWVLDEFVFVPFGGEAGEDEGVLVGFAYDAATDRSDLKVLDAATLDDVAAVHLPVRVPHGFHGNWVPTLAH